MEKEEIIRFCHEEEWAKTKFNNYLKKKVFKTKEFSNGLNIENIRKVYVPFYKFETNNNIRAFIELSSTDEPYRYYERIIDAKLENVINGANNLNDDYISNIMPYNLNKLIDINSTNIECEKIVDIKNINDVKKSNLNDIQSNVKNIAIKSCPAYLSEHKNIISKVTTNYESDVIIYLPVWIIETKANDKKYEFYLNDQTGKIAGDVPVSQFNNYKLVVKLCIIVLLILILLTYLSAKYKNDIILYAVGIVFAILILFLIYIGIISRYSMKYKFSKARVISKKYIKKKRYWITELYLKARKEFESERDNDN